jgi:predicted anti-sigma-YlaC factor YlaD
MTMDCQTVRTAILELLEHDTPSALGHETEAHLADCAACARFAERQNALNARLTRELMTPPMSPGLRLALRKRIRAERRSLGHDALPDVVHFASWAGATLLSAVLLPLSAPIVLGAGVVLALLAYVPLTVMRESLEGRAARD